MSAHTPGPWETSVNDEGQWDVCAEGGGDMVADLSDCPGNAEGNARLIAAAPDLLALVTEFEVAVSLNYGPTRESSLLALAAQARTLLATVTL